MNKILLLFLSFAFGTVHSQNIIQTENPFHPCQKNTCENKSVITITSPNEVSEFSLIAPQISLPITAENMENFIISEFNLTSTSSDFDFVYAVCSFNTLGWHTSWNSVENISGAAFDPVYSTQSFTSILCGEWASNTASNVNSIRRRLGLTNIDIEKLWMNGHVTLRYFDRQYQKWVYCDSDHGGTNVAFVSDGNGFYASPEEIINNPSLILSNETIVFNGGDMTNDCAKNLFFEDVDNLFSSYYYTQIIDSIPRLEDTKIRISPGITVTLYDEVGDYYTFDTLGLTSLIIGLCGDSIPSFLQNLPPDDGCAPDDTTPLCLLEAIGILNGFPNLEQDFYPFLQSGEWYSYNFGLPAEYQARFTRGDSKDILKIKFLPGDYSSDYFYAGYILKSLNPGKDGVPYMFNGENYNSSFHIEKYSSRENEDADSIFLNPQNQIVELGVSAFVPEEIDSLVVEFYANSNVFPFMHEVQKILVHSGNISMSQEFKYEPLINTIEDEEIEEVDRYSQLTVYPNPTTGLINISEFVPTDLFIYNALSQIIGIINKGEQAFNLSNFPAGIYFIPEIMKKIIKE